MRTIQTIAAFLWAAAAFAQGNLKEENLNGPVKKVTITHQSFPDTITKTPTTSYKQWEKSFDKKGNKTMELLFDSDNKFVNKSTYRRNDKWYRKYTSNTDDDDSFEKNFTVQKEAPKRSGGSGTGNPQESKGSVTDVIYDKKGNVAETIKYSDKGYAERHVYTYDGNNNKTSEKTINAYNEEGRGEITAFGANGKISERVYTAGGRPVGKTVHEYDTKEREIKITEYNQNGANAGEVTYTYTDLPDGGEKVESNTVRNGKFDYKTVKVFNKEKLETEIIRYGEDGSVYNKTLNLYRKGRLVKTMLYNSEGTLQERVEYEYDTHGNQIHYRKVDASRNKVYTMHTDIAYY